MKAGALLFGMLVPCAVQGALLEPGGSSLLRLVFSGCRDGAEVVRWKLAGAGHVWPGRRRDYLRRWLGPSTLVIDANEEMWRFFTCFSIRGAKP